MGAEMRTPLRVRRATCDKESSDLKNRVSLGISSLRIDGSRDVETAVHEDPNAHIKMIQESDSLLAFDFTGNQRVIWK